MTPVKHSHCNDVLRAPEGDANREGLHICREAGQVWSFWTPNAEELAAIVKGGEIALCVQGTTHPPLSLHVMAPDYAQDLGKTTDPDQIKALFVANRERAKGMTLIAKRAIAALVAETGDKSDPLVNEFLDLLLLNREPNEIVRDYKPEPEPPTV